MTGYSRVTVVGSHRRIDLVLPADERVGTMTGDLIRLLDEPVMSPPLHRYLVTTSGDVLAGDTTLAAAAVEDGSVLRLVGEERLPPAPVVYDVVEETAADRDARSWLFGIGARQVLGGAVLAAAVLAMAALTRSAGVLPLAPAIAAVAFAAVGILLGRLGRRPAAAACVATGVLTGVLHVSTDAATTGWHRWALGALVLAVTPLVFAVAGWPPRGALLGGGTALLLLASWVGGVLLDVPTTQVAAVLAVLGVAVLGFLPRAALLLSGVGALDDRRSAAPGVVQDAGRSAAAGVMPDSRKSSAAGVMPAHRRSAVRGGMLDGRRSAVPGVTPDHRISATPGVTLDHRRSAVRGVARADVRMALAAAHQGLVLAAVATAGSGALAGVVLATDLTVWSVPLGCLLAFVLLSRARIFPLTVQVVALVGAAVTVAVAFSWAWARGWSGVPVGPLAVLAAVAVLGVLAVTLSLPEHTQARLRIALDRLEMLAVVAMIPLVVGIFGTYSRLLGMY